MFDETASSQCESENIIYRLFWMFIRGKTKEEALNALKDDKPTSEDLPQNNSENEWSKYTKSNGGRTEYTSRKSFRRRFWKATTGLERLSQCNHWECNKDSCNRSSLILFRLVNQKDADVSSAKLQVSFFNTSSSILREVFVYENTVKTESKSKISLSLFDTRRI